MKKRVRPFGRLARAAVGALLIAAVLPFVLQGSAPFLLRSFSVLLLLVVFYIALDAVMNRFVPAINPWFGATLANVPVILMYLLGAPGGPIFGAGEGQLASLAYVGLALLVAGLRADAGCEVMSIPGLIFRRHTHLACIAFSPIDWLEQRLSR